jgi:hypothetical protein
MMLDIPLSDNLHSDKSILMNLNSALLTKNVDKTFPHRSLTFLPLSEI